MVKPRPLIAGNWKLNKGPAEARAFGDALAARLGGIPGGKVDIVVAPPFVSLPALTARGFFTGAQDVYWEDKGAFTGEVSAAMLRELGVEYCIVGHSERRQFFGETDRTVNLKAASLLAKGIRPVLCVGERAEERKAGIMFNVVQFQLNAGLFDIGIKDPGDIVIAYEPVWAIGTGNVATPQQAEDMHEEIRRFLEKRFGVDTGCRIRILYGGSVNENNIEGLMDMDHINGALIGGVSLDLDKFLSIINLIVKREK